MKTLLKAKYKAACFLGNFKAVEFPVCESKEEAEKMIDGYAGSYDYGKIEEVFVKAEASPVQPITPIIH